VSNPKADCEELTDYVLYVARRLLIRSGGFVPYGGAMLADGELVAISADVGEHPTLANVIARMKDQFRVEARNGSYKATAIVHDAMVALPSTGEESDAVAIALNHRDNYSIVVFLPYKIDGGKLIFGTTFAQKGEADIFPPR
jgi:hypothetical protein